MLLLLNLSRYICVNKIFKVEWLSKPKINSLNLDKTFTFSYSIDIHTSPSHKVDGAPFKTQFDISFFVPLPQLKEHCDVATQSDQEGHD